MQLNMCFSAQRGAGGGGVASWFGMGEALNRSFWEAASGRGPYGNSDPPRVTDITEKVGPCIFV